MADEVLYETEGEIVVITLMWLILSFRVVAFPLIIAAIWCSRTKSHRLRAYVCWSIFVLSTLTPYTDPRLK